MLASSTRRFFSDHLPFNGHIPFSSHFLFFAHFPPGLFQVFQLHSITIQSLEQLSYAGIFLAVAFSGYLIPIPEELVLLGGGFLAAEGFSNIFLILAVCILGAVAGDTMVYYLAGHGSRFTKKYHERVEKTHAGWYLEHLRSKPFLTIFCSRFIVGMRVLNPLVSGLTGVSWRTFVGATLLSACIYVPIIVSIGWVFHAQIYNVIILAQSIRQILFALLAVGSAVLISLFITNLLESKK